MRTVFATLLGMFAVEAEQDGITRLHFPGHIPPGFRSDGEPSPLLFRARREIREFATGERTTFALPLKPSGGDFMLKVWEVLTRTSYGDIVTYGEVAKRAGNPGAARAVGAACRNNPIPLLIPCHRVIGANGKLTGFYGGGLDLKRRLLELEARGTGLFERAGP